MEREAGTYRRGDGFATAAEVLAESTSFSPRQRQPHASRDGSPLRWRLPESPIGVLKAWRELGAGELCDCEEFHSAINEHSWHRDGKLQSTWRPLILLLITFLQRPADKDSLRRYQQTEWGKTNGETCVIELSGLAANNLAVPRDRESFLLKRIDVIRERMRENHPQLVVMYGMSERKSWEKIAARGFPPDKVLISNGSILVLTLHPTAHGMKNAYWENLGQRLRSVSF